MKTLLVTIVLQENELISGEVQIYSKINLKVATMIYGA
jgi:hypothetical protein